MSAGVGPPKNIDSMRETAVKQGKYRLKTPISPLKWAIISCGLFVSKHIINPLYLPIACLKSQLIAIGRHKCLRTNNHVPGLLTSCLAHVGLARR